MKYSTSDTTNKTISTTMTNYVGPLGMIGCVFAFFASLAQWGDPIWALVHAWFGWLAIIAWWLTGRPDFLKFVDGLRWAIWHLITVAS